MHNTFPTFQKLEDSLEGTSDMAGGEKTCWYQTVMTIYVAFITVN